MRRTLYDGLSPPETRGIAVGANAAILRRFLDKIQAGDYAGALAETHPDIVLDEPSALPQGGIFTGRDAPGRVKQIILGIWDQGRGELQTWDSGDVVFMGRDITWTCRATGKSAFCPVLEKFEFRDGMIARITVYVKDEAALLATLKP